MLRFPMLVLSGSFLLLAACSSDDEADPVGGNGVNDVGQACAIQATWTRSTATSCYECLGYASTPKCDCPATAKYGGMCAAQQQARNDEPECQGTGQCVFACAAGDCACVDDCYAGTDACRVRAAALDGCLTEVCEEACLLAS